MNALKVIPVALSFLLISALPGCSKPPAPPTLSLSEAQEKFVDLCQKEYNLPVVLKALPNTTWIYLPVKEGFFEFKLNQEGSKPTSQPSEQLTINFIDGKFSERSFRIDYDVSSSRTYSKDYGFSSRYTEEYQKVQQNLLAAVSRVFADLPSNQKPTDFFVIVIADIVSGIESQLVFAFQDLKRAMTDVGFVEEYVKRIMSDYPVGKKKIIGDETGRHLELKDFTWPEFIAKQIVFRAQFKYLRSSFEPSAVAKEEILSCVREAVQAYDFEDFDAVVLTDLVTGQSESIAKELIPKEIPSEQLVVPISLPAREQTNQ